MASQGGGAGPVVSALTAQLRRPPTEAELLPRLAPAGQEQAPARSASPVTARLHQLLQAEFPAARTARAATKGEAS
jgi:hypothetical protein